LGVVHIGGEFSDESNSQQQKHKTCLRTLVCDGRLGAVVAAIWNRLQDSPDGISEFSDWAVGNDAPTSIILASFKAKLTPKNKVRLKWQTANESKLVGFNVYRRAGKNKPWVKLNAAQIDAVHIGQSEGGTYQWIDKTVKAGKTYRYQLEILQAGDASLWSESVKITVP